MKKFNFIHAPRCGGMSFFYFLEECLEKKSCVRFGDASSVRFFHEQPNCNFLADYTLVSGHLTIKDFYDKQLITKERATFSFARDPSEQIKSIIKYTLENRYPEHNQFKEQYKSINYSIKKIINEVYENSSYVTFYNLIERNSPPQKIIESLEKLPNIFLFSMQQIGEVAMLIRGEKLFFPIPTNKSSKESIDITSSAIEEEIEIYKKGKFFQKNMSIYQWILEKSEKNISCFADYIG